MAGKTKPGKPVKGINIKLKMINDLMDVTGSAKDSWNPAEISDDMKAIAYIHDLADTWNPAQLNEALKYLGFATIDSWNPAIIEETKNKLVKYFLPTEASGNPAIFNACGNLPYEIDEIKVIASPKQSGTGVPSPSNIRNISGYTEVNLYHDSEVKENPDKTYTADFDNNTYYSIIWDVLEGKAVINKVLITFTGSEDENWNLAQNAFYIDAAFADASEDFVTEGTTSVCNMYMEEGYVSTSSQVPARADMSFFNQKGTYYQRLWVKNSTYTTVSDFKESLSNQNLVIVYPLGTPIELTLTSEEIELLKGSNAFWTDGTNVYIKYKALLNS